MVHPPNHLIEMMLQLSDGCFLHVIHNDAHKNYCQGYNEYKIHIDLHILYAILSIL